MLLSTRQIRADLILSHYYVRQDVEQVFDISKNYASLLPLNVEKEETFRGHLLMTFIATGVSGFLCLGRLFQGQPNEAALCI